MEFRRVLFRSANLSGAQECLLAGEVALQIGDEIEAIVDLGKTAGDRGSTVIDASGPLLRILREGTISRDIISRFVPLT